jgi:intraflagellar transport protein 172
MASMLFLISKNFNIYKKLVFDTMKLDSLNSTQNYKTWANLRDVMYSLTQNLAKSPEKDGADHRDFEKLFLVAHYNAMRSACSLTDQLNTMAAKLSISLLRHTDMIPADKAFYEAGIICQVILFSLLQFLLPLYERLKVPIN